MLRCLGLRAGKSLRGENPPRICDRVLFVLPDTALRWPPDKGRCNCCCCCHCLLLLFVIVVIVVIFFVVVIVVVVVELPQTPDLRSARATRGWRMRYSPVDACV